MWTLSTNYIIGIGKGALPFIDTDFAVAFNISAFFLTPSHQASRTGLSAGTLDFLRMASLATKSQSLVQRLNLTVLVIALTLQSAWFPKASSGDEPSFLRA